MGEEKESVLVELGTCEAALRTCCSGMCLAIFSRLTRWERRTAFRDLSVAGAAGIVECAWIVLWTSAFETKEKSEEESESKESDDEELEDDDDEEEEEEEEEVDDDR